MTKNEGTSANGKLLFEVDESAQVLRVRYVGHITAGGVQAALPEARLAVSLMMRPGFVMLTDMSRAESFESQCAPHIGKLMDLFMERGLSSVVRVVTDPAKDIGFNILARFHYRENVTVVTMESLEAAEAHFQK